MILPLDGYRRTEEGRSEIDHFELLHPAQTTETTTTGKQMPAAKQKMRDIFLSILISAS